MTNASLPVGVQQTSASTATAAGVTGAGHYRWVICALLFFAATINYIDRQVIGILKPTLQLQFGWSEIDYSDIVFAFQLAYAVGFLVAGRMIDKLGARTGFAVAIVVWSLAAIAHAEAPVFGTAVASALARPATFRRRLRSWPYGSRSASVRSPQVSSTRAPILARC